LDFFQLIENPWAKAHFVKNLIWEVFDLIIGFIEANILIWYLICLNLKPKVDLF
jgi:hypothetical protein